LTFSQSHISTILKTFPIKAKACLTNDNGSLMGFAGVFGVCDGWFGWFAGFAAGLLLFRYPPYLKAD
jgi:hypothetical protein